MISIVAPTEDRNEIAMSNNDVLLNKHVISRIKHAEMMSSLSPCTRGTVGAVIFDPSSYAIIADGYNGPPRKGGNLCGGDSCVRADKKIISGTQCEVGCHHAEMNAILNAVRLGHSTLNTSIAITCEPCLMCAKMIHHAGMTSVFYTSSGYSQSGVAYLIDAAVIVKELECFTQF